MKRILNIIYFVVLLASLSFGQDLWYVDNTASGSNNGTSWANAWNSFASINWASVGAGDTIFVSGGSTSKTYTGQLAPDPSTSGTASNYIVITEGKYATPNTGHTGEVILTGGILFDAAGSAAPDYIKVKGFEVTGGNNISFDCDYPGLSKGIYLESLYIHDYGSQFGIRVISYQDSLIIDSCIVIDCLDAGGSCGGERDCIHFNYDGSSYARNTIIRNSYFRSVSQDPVAHNDAFQSATADGFVIYNSVFINDSVYSQQGGGIPLIISSNDIDQNDYPPVILFNNFVYMGGVWYPDGNFGKILNTRHDGNSSVNYQSPTYVFNNTLVANGPRVSVTEQEYHIDFYSNNIVASFCLPDGTFGQDWRTGGTHGWHTSLYGSDAYSSNMYRDSTRNNLFWRQDNDQNLFGGSFFTTGSSTISPGTWSDWLTGGGTGVNVNPLFIDNFGAEPDQGILTGQVENNSPAINAGEDLTYLANWLASTFNLPNDIKDAMLKDKNGVTRSTWDVGAYEYSDGAWTPPDTIPSYSFTALNNMELSTAYIASSTFTGADSTFTVYTTTGARFNINSSSNLSTTAKTATNGDVVYIETLTGVNYSTGYSETLIAGGVSRSFTVTTKAYVPPPSGNGGILRGSDGIWKDKNGVPIRVTQ